MASQRKRLAALHAGLIRRGLLDDAERMRTAMVAAGLEEDIRSALANPTPPTVEQRRDLAALLLGDSGVLADA